MEQLKKYKLQDLVANGSNARRKVNSDLLVGNVSGGYGYGDILDANATVKLVGDKISDLHMDALSQNIAEQVAALKEKDIVYGTRLDALEEKHAQMSTEYTDGHLTISFS